MAIDLHIHSVYSDGSYTPTDIIAMSNNLGLTAISITDHDSIEAYDNIDLKKSGLMIIPGIEITTHSPFEVHILGYFVDTSSVKLKEEISKNNLKRQRDMLTLAYDLYHKNYIKLSPVNISRKYGRVNINQLYSEISQKDKCITVTDFYHEKELLNNSIIGISPEDAMKQVKKYGGFASLAHPNRLYNNAQMDKESISNYILSLKEYGLKAIECYHESFLESDIKFYTGFAENNNLLISGGSDFHGDKKPNVDIGIGRGNLNIPDYVIDNLLQKRSI